MPASCRTTPSEAMRIVDGVRVLLRSYLVVDVGDMSVLPRDGSEMRGVGSVSNVDANGKTANTSSSSNREAKRGRDHRTDADGRASVRPPQDEHPCSASAVEGGRGEGEGQGEGEASSGSSAAEERKGATFTSAASLFTKSRRHQPQQQGGRKVPSPQEMLSVSEALCVRLAGSGIATPASNATASSDGGRSGGGKGKGEGKGRGRGGGGGRGRGPKLDSTHERESVTVRGFLRDVGFRVVADGGGADRGRRSAAASAGAITEGSVKGRGRGREEGKNGECNDDSGG